MGCGSSTSTAVVRPLSPEKLKGDEDETGSKHSSRGDSAVSKSTTDSGVVMENREVPMLPGTVPRKLPPLTPTAVSPPLLRRDSQTQERQKSSEILEELSNQGIIPLGPSRENSGATGEAYSIMLNAREGTLRKPPARLESLKENKTQLSKEEIDEKIRLAEERRKQKEDEMKSRLRAKSARIRVPARSQSTGEEEDPIEQLLAPPQGPQPAEGGMEAERGATSSGRGSRNTQEKQEESADVKERGEDVVVPMTRDDELSDSADSDVTMADRSAADRACKDPNPIIDGRKANVNLAYLGAKPRVMQPGFTFGVPQIHPAFIQRPYGIPAHYVYPQAFVQPSMVIPHVPTAAAAPATASSPYIDYTGAAYAQYSAAAATAAAAYEQYPYAASPAAAGYMATPGYGYAVQQPLAATTPAAAAAFGQYQPQQLQTDRMQ